MSGVICGLTGPPCGDDTCVMRRIRLRETRKERGLSVRALADLAGVDHATVSRIETGDRGMSVEMAEKLANALQTTPAHLLGIDNGGHSGATAHGMSDDAEPYVAPDNPAESPITIRRAARDTIEQFRIKTHALDALGYKPGDIVFVDIGQASVDGLEPGRCVVVQHYSDIAAATKLRQFIAPALLITNSRRHNEVPLNIETDDVAIKGVIVGQYTPRN